MSISLRSVPGPFRFNETGMRAVLSDRGDLGQFLLEVARDVEAEAKRLTTGIVLNVDTGRLSGSITHVLESRGGDVVALVGTNVKYGLYHELGGPRTRKRAFLVPALEKVLRERGLS